MEIDFELYREKFLVLVCSSKELTYKYTNLSSASKKNLTELFLILNKSSHMDFICCPLLVLERRLCLPIYVPT